MFGACVARARLPLAFLGGVFVLFDAFEQPSTALFAFTAIEIVWEASLALYLTFRGYRPSPLLAEGQVGQVRSPRT